MNTDIDAEVAALRRLTLAQLRPRYAEVFGEPSPITNNKAWLIKRIAWRLQALAEGDLSERARRRAAELANDADLRILPPRRPTATVRSGGVAIRGPATENDGLPPPGTRLIRQYKGQTLEVDVTVKGYEYQGRVFASLSALAKEITGSHCSGVRFFRLSKHGGQA